MINPLWRIFYEMSIKLFFYKYKYYYLSIIWGGIILILSGYPGDKIPQTPIIQADKSVHVFIYAILAFLMLIPYTAQYIKQEKRLINSLKIISIGFVYGGLMEILQETVFAHRSGNMEDLIANIGGLFLGVLLFSFSIKKIAFFRRIK
jgi:VanZ family protein